MEGDPHPGTVRGRISFQNFNPSIDKLNGMAVNGEEEEASTSSAFKSGRNLGRIEEFRQGWEWRENGAPEHMDMNVPDNEAERELKRKHTEEVPQNSHPKKLKKDTQGNKQPSSSENSSCKQKREKLDHNVLMPTKSQSKRGGG